MFQSRYRNTRESSGEPERAVVTWVEVQINLRDIAGILLPLDFRKAFDTIEWEFIQRNIALFNFAENTQRWIFILAHILDQNRKCRSKLWFLHKLFSLVKRSETS